MHENEHLAIASVPIQQWGQVYDEKEALKNGTVFPALNKPFFVTEQGPSGNHPGMENRGTNPNPLRRESKSASLRYLSQRYTMPDKTVGFDAYYIDHTTALWPQAGSSRDSLCGYRITDHILICGL